MPRTKVPHPLDAALRKHVRDLNPFCPVCVRAAQKPRLALNFQLRLANGSGDNWPGALLLKE
jgi:hypothetical protein